MEKYSNQELVDMYYSGYKKIPQSHIDDLTQKTIEKIKKISKGYKKIVVGYSSGKDSIVVEDLCKKSGIKYIPVMWRTIYHYTKTLDWIKNNKPENTIEIILDRPSWDDLEKNEMLQFCGEKKADTFWMSHKWKAQKQFLKEYGCDLFITGRRTRDKNNCGKKENDYVKIGKDHNTFSPIAEWTIQEVIAYLRYNNLELSPQYLEIPDGFLNGSIAYLESFRFGRFKCELNDKWDEVYNIEKDQVYRAAKYLTSAREYLKWRENNEIRKNKD